MRNRWAPRAFGVCDRSGDVHKQENRHCGGGPLRLGWAVIELHCGSATTCQKMIIVVVGVESNRGFCCERVDCFVPPLDAMKDPVHPIPRSRGRSALFIRFSVQSTDTDGAGPGRPRAARNAAKTARPDVRTLDKAITQKRLDQREALWPKPEPRLWRRKTHKSHDAGAVFELKGSVTRHSRYDPNVR